MTPRWERERPGVAVLRGITLVAALALAASRAPIAIAADPSPAAARSGKTPVIWHKSRSFRIPFNVGPEDRPLLKEVRLHVSEDSGDSWKMTSRTTPERPVFTFRASHDGEYLFAVQTVDKQGKTFPAKEEKVEPSMKVIVDTAPPTLSLERNGRRGSLASVRWDMRDENLDPRSLVLEYQAEGGRDWRNLPIDRYSLIGRADWDAGTAEPVKVRASVADKAGNVAEATVTLAEGTPSNPSMAGSDSEINSPSPISQISTGPKFATADTNPPAGEDPFAALDASNKGASPAPATAPPDNGYQPAAPEGDPFAGAGAAPAPDSPAPAQPGAGAPQQPMGVQLVSSPRFPVQYAVDDAGPGGPVKVELWVTQDGGKSWFMKGEDSDRTSPFPVDLGGEGTFGIRLVARGSSGLGDSPPVPGDAPHMTVEVDSTPPTVQIMPPKVGTGQHVGKLAITWRASDIHLGPKAATLSWRPEQTGSRWQTIAESLDSNGQYVWVVPASVPARFHVRVDVVDEAGNRGYAETTEGTPVYLDRTRPRTRIIGLDPSARTGMRAGGGPVR